MYARAKRTFASIFMTSVLCLSGCGQPDSSRSAGKPHQSTDVDTAEAAAERLARSNAPWLAAKNERMTLSEAKIALKSAYRLKPDRRFILAVKQCERLLRGKADENVQVLFENQRWTIKSGSRTVGSLSELPDFNEMLALLVNWSKKVAGDCNFHPDQNGSELSAGDQMLALPISDSMKKLTECDRSWKEKGPSIEVLRMAETHLVSLCCSNPDVLDVTDEVRANAVSLTAVLTALSPSAREVEAAALLADDWRYFADAKSISRKLPPDNVVRLYVMRDRNGLERAVRKDNSRIAKYLYTRLLAGSTDRYEWLAFIKSNFADDPSMTLPVLSTYQTVATVESLIPFASYLMIDSLDEVRRGGTSSHTIGKTMFDWTRRTSGESTTWMYKGLLSDFEQALIEFSTRHAAADALFLSSAHMRDIYRGYFYSGVAILADSYAQLPYARNICREFAQVQRSSLKSPQAAELMNWFSSKVEIVKRSQSLAHLPDDLKNLSYLGPAAKIALVGVTGMFFLTYDQEMQLSAGRALFQSVDSRAFHRLRLAEMARLMLVDRRLTEEILQAANRSRSKMYYREQYLETNGDYSKIKQLLHHWRWSPQVALAIAKYCEYDQLLKEEQMTALFDQIARESDFDLEIVKEYAIYLRKKGKNEKARQLLSGWIARKADADDFDKAEVRSCMAEVYLSEGQYQKGLDALGNAPETELLPCLTTKLRLLEKLDRRADAQLWADEMLKRYPNDPSSIIAFAGFCWKFKLYDQAAKILKSHYSALVPNDWGRSLTPVFLETFKDDGYGGLRALDSLRDEGIGSADDLGHMAREAFARKIPEWSWNFVSYITVTSENEEDTVAAAYSALKQWKGEKIALSWLRSKVKEADRYKYVNAAFGLGGYSELLWEFLPAELDERHAERIWLLRAADAVLSHKPVDDRKLSALKKHFAREDGLDGALGRRLLGMKNADNLLAKPLRKEQLCLASFYVGLHALRYPHSITDDTSWYKVCLETDCRNMPEYKWARGWLYRIEHSLAQTPYWSTTGFVKIARASLSSDNGYPTQHIEFGGAGKSGFLRAAGRTWELSK